MNKQATKWESSFRLPNQGLRAYFAHVENGQPVVYRTSFYAGKTQKAVLNAWSNQLSKIEADWPTLWDYEIDLQKKVGPMSVMQPLKKRLKDIDSYYDSILLESKPIPDDAVGAVIREFAAISGLRVRSQERTVSGMRLSTNSGSPFFTKRRNVLSETVPCQAFMTGEVCWSLLGRGRTQWSTPAILGWRGQEGGPSADDVKQRVIWMFPLSVNILELQVYQPLIEASQRFNLVPAWVGLDAVDARVTALFDTKGRDQLVVATDFSKFDQHFNPTMQRAAADILNGLLTQDASTKSWMLDVFPIKYHIPLAYDWEKIRTGLHGMGSGSGGTNADETLVHRALQHEAAQSAGQSLNPNSMCLGDDGILTFPGITVEHVVDVYSSHGQEMNVSKQYASADDCIYLRRWHHRDYRVGGVCVGVYSTMRALGRLMYQERYYDPESWGPKMVALRQLSILENVKFHPMKEQFVQYCIKGDKYRLGLDIPGFLDDIESIALEAINLMPDFLGYTRSISPSGSGDYIAKGIGAWWIVEYLKSLK